jgi:hypothetical protein
MKHLSRIPSLLILVSSVLFLAGCNKDDDGGTETDELISKLSGTWNATSVTYNGQQQADYADFALLITGSEGNEAVAYSTEGRPAAPKRGPWSSGGLLEFGDPVASQLVRDDNVEIAYSVTETTLRMEFTFTGIGYDGPARTESIEGEWVFEFEKAQ